MVTGIKANGTDLDSIFAARSTTKRANVNYLSNGSVDISNRFQEYTTGTKASLTNLKAGGIDLANLFQKYGVPIYTVTLTGASISDVSPSHVCTAGVMINSDGTVDRLVNTTYTQISSTTDWIIPNTSADSTFDVRITGVSWTSGTTFFSAAAAADLWVPLSSNRLWSVRDADSSGGGNQQVSFTVQIRKDGGATLASASYTLTANYSTV